MMSTARMNARQYTCLDQLMTRAVSLLFILLVGLGLYIVGVPSAGVSRPADTIVVNGRIYTVDPGRPQAEGLAIRGGRLIAVGSVAEVMAYRGPGTEVLDVGRRAVIPGLHDAHGHFTGLGASLQQLDLRDTASEAALADLVRQRAAETRAGTWITGRGWDQNLWPDAAWPTAATLDAAAPDHPVYLTRVDGHAVLVNTAALHMAQIDAETADPPGGSIIRDDQGQPAGVLVDTAMSLVSRHLPLAGPDTVSERIALADATCARLGITTVHDAGVPLSVARTYRTLVDEGRLATRLYVMLAAPARDDPPLPPRLIGYGNQQLTIRAVKLVADGALGSRGAWLLEPYADEPESTGLAVTAPDELYRQTLAVARAGYQPCIHAIGDAANRHVLDVFERVQREVPGSRALRMRNEHAQILHPDDIPRFAALGVIASVQATHATSDMAWVPSRIGDARTRAGAYVWRSLLEAGARLANGSDFPVEDPNPMRGFHAAITRQDERGVPPDGWMPGQRLTRPEALRTFTLDAAYAAHLEHDLGSLRPGKLADLVVLSHDIMDVAPADILQTTVVLTMVGGRIVHRDGL
jgi:predicted amidohydrolase YtcJ